MTARVACPVCGKGCKNAQGLGGHLAHSKDQDHARYRATGHLPTTPAAAPGAPAAASSAQGGPAPWVRPPPEPNTPEWGAWMAEQFNLNLAKWLQQREDRRAERRAPQAPGAQGAPRAPAAPQTAQRAPEPAPERVEDFGDAYWRRLLGDNYRPRREDADGR
ncbi:MAG: hypothetical protein QOG31_1079 [Thermoplasmata archaeon]|jgi:hypothetical protein|nr:hypothetical protein [Thermoplasmata archaeon]